MDEPETGCNLSNAETVKITIQNTGTWTIPADSTIEIGFTRDGVTKTEDYTFTEPLAPTETLQITLTNTMDLSTRKTHNINIWATLDSDMVVENNDLDIQVTAYPDVLVDFGADTIYIIGEYVLDPGEYYEYLWSNDAETQTITVSTSGSYWVEVSNEQGCSDRDTVVIEYTAPDIHLESFVAPQNSCGFTQNEEVAIRFV